MLTRCKSSNRRLLVAPLPRFHKGSTLVAQANLVLNE